MAFEVMDIQPTPNPNALKFILNQTIADPPMSFFDARAAQSHPLAARLFEVPGVSSLLLLGDFITVNKDPAASWNAVKHGVREAIAQTPERP
jgi:NFU1 iron-sulfur cluster scaffold homolog, mitochondrial